MSTMNADDELRQYLSNSPDVAALNTPDAKPTRRRETAVVGPSEHDEQKALFDWLDYTANQDWRYGMAFAIPNGQYRHGQRPEPGLKAGVPDIMIAYPIHRWSGLFIEMKVGKNVPSAAQEQWLEHLARAGYKTAVCYGFDEARQIIEEYLL